MPSPYLAEFQAAAAAGGVGMVFHLGRLLMETRRLKYWQVIGAMLVSMGSGFIVSLLAQELWHVSIPLAVAVGATMALLGGTLFVDVASRLVLAAAKAEIDRLSLSLKEKDKDE